VRVTTFLNRMIGLPGLRVKRIREEGQVLVIEIDRRFQLLTCPLCGKRVRGRFEEKVRRWRHWRIWDKETFLEGPIRRLRCPTCGVQTEAVPWARHASAFTRVFEDLVGALAQKVNRTAVAEMTGIAWQTVGNIAERLVHEQLGPERLQGLRRIGVDEISYRKHHRYLTVVVDHDEPRVVWVGEGKSTEALLTFFTELGAENTAALELISMDMSAAYESAVRVAAPQARIVFDHFHVARLANDAVDEVRRAQVAALPPSERSSLKRTRWPILKRSRRLKSNEKTRLSRIERDNRPLYRAYLLKESFLDILSAARPTEAAARLRNWLAWASRSKLEPFVKFARTVRHHRDAILRIVESKLTNARLEGMNNNIRLLSHRSYGLHSANALIALIYLCYSKISLPELHLI